MAALGPGRSAFFLLLAALGADSSALELRLVARDGGPLAGARVQVLDRPGSYLTGRDGRVTILPDPAPPFALLIARADGVALPPVAITDIPDGLLEVAVELSYSESVTVVADAAADVELPPAAAFSLVRAADIARRSPATIAEVLEGIPGAARAGDGMAAVPALRGLAAGRTLILLDEGRVSGERRAGVSASFLDPGTVDEIEVVRGPGTVAYGSDAFGGVIRARTAIPDGSRPLEVRLRLAAADATGERSADVQAGLPLAGGGLLLAASARRFDDYDAPGGTVSMSGGRGAGLRLGYQRPALGGMLRLLWRSDSSRDVGKPASDSGVVPTSYPEEESHRATLQLDRAGPGAWSRIGLVASWDSSRLVTRRDRLAAGARPREVTDAAVEAQDWGLRGEAERSLGPGLLVVGFDGSVRFGLDAVNRSRVTGSEERTEVSVAGARRQDLALFAGYAARIGAIGLSSGLRLDQVQTSSAGGFFGRRSSSHASPSGFVALSLTLAPGFEAAFQAARGFRDPLLSDRYYRGISGRGFVVGNPDLSPETSVQLDGALRIGRGPARLALFGYRYRIDDLVERYRWGDDYLFRNRGGAVLSGVELEGSLDLGAGLVLAIGGQRARGRTENGSPTDAVPADGGFVVLRQSRGRWSWSARIAAFAADERPGPTERVVPGATVVDLGAGRRLSEQLELRLLARNLLDRSYLGSADERTVEAPGRSLRLALHAVL